jgi:hypothetical protein
VAHSADLGVAQSGSASRGTSDVPLMLSARPFVTSKPLFGRVLGCGDLSPQPYAFRLPILAGDIAQNYRHTEVKKGRIWRRDALRLLRPTRYHRLEWVRREQQPDDNSPTMLCTSGRFSCIFFASRHARGPPGGTP